MKKFFRIFLFLPVLLVNPIFGQITTSATTASNAVQNVLLGAGITATNITYTGYVNAIGTFTATGTTNLGITKGVYLTSGSILQNDPNGNPFAFGEDGPMGPSSNEQNVEQNSSFPPDNGDPNLDALASPEQSADAAVLEFDFIPQSDTIKFNYTFGSEEYNDYVGPNYSFNDVFGFFLSGPNPAGGNYTNLNIATLPGSNTIVSIQNVNNGNSGTTASGPCQNCQYYRDNYNGNINCVYDGMTVVLQAKQVVVCGQSYHIKLAVADVGDHEGDSGVFLEGGSFETGNPINVVLNDMKVCAGDPANIVISVSGGFPPYNLTWNSLISGSDNVTVLNDSTSIINNTQSGGIFILTATDHCTKNGKDTIVIQTEDCEVHIPNVITPNGDGINEMLYFKNLEKFPGSSLVVFNRWGNKVFESPSYNNAWTPDVLDGIYYFALHTSDGKNFTGYFHVFRQK